MSKSLYNPEIRKIFPTKNLNTDERLQNRKKY